MKIVYCLLCKDRTEELKLSVRSHCPFFDHSVIILHGLNKENEEFLTSEECNKFSMTVKRTMLPYDPKALRDLYMEELDLYLDKVQEPVWFIILDSDEYLELPALYTLRQIAQAAENENINVVGFNSHDIQTAPDGSVWENKSGYWNPNFNKMYKGMRYTPGTHIGLARPEPVRMAQSAHKYYHIKTVSSQWLRGCRNAWSTCATAQNRTDDPVWIQLKALWHVHGYKDFASFYAAMEAGNLHEDFKQWFIMNRNHENSEFRSFYAVYYVFLHPEENIGCVGNRDFDYDKSRRPNPGMTF